MLDVSLLSPHDMVQWLNEPLSHWREEVRGMPRQPLEGMISGHSRKKGTRTVKLKDCGLPVTLANIKDSVFDGFFRSEGWTKEQIS